MGTPIRYGGWLGGRDRGLGVRASQQLAPIPMDGFGIGDLSDEGAGLGFVAEGEERPLLATAAGQSSDVEAVVGDRLGVGEVVPAERCIGAGDPNASDGV